MSHNFYQTLFSSSRDTKSKPFLITENEKLITYQDLNILSGRIADKLYQLDISKGDRLIAKVDKSVEALALYLGCLRSGIIFVPLNPAFTQFELQYYLSDAEPKIIVCNQNERAEIETLAHQMKINWVKSIDSVDEYSLIPTTETESNEAFDLTTVDVAPEDIAVIIYTSGTTGKPKGAMLSHRNLAVNGSDLKNHWDFTEKDILLHCLPIFHVHGLFFAVHCVMLAGASMVFLPNFSENGVLKFLPQTTVMMGVPTYYTRLLANQNFQQVVCSKMRLFISGSAPLKPKTYEEFKSRTGFSILERYGMSETGVNTSNPLVGERRLGTVGLSLGESELRIVDENNQSVPPFQIGSIQVKGKNVFAGYWRMPEKTLNEFTEDGFFKTGDLGKYSADGYVSLVGRAKDLIISGGLNVYPVEVEACLNEIEGIVESAVIGLPQSDFGEAVTAVIVASEAKITTEQIKVKLKQVLANYKIPKKFIYLEQLPRNSLTKVQKNELRKTYKLLYQ